MKNSTCIRIVFISGLFFTMTLQAKTEITPIFGYRFGGEFTDITAVSKLKVTDDNIAGFLVSFDKDARAQYEFLYSHQSSRLKTNASVGNNILFDMDIDYIQIGGTALWPELWPELRHQDKVTPFLAGGLGLTHMSPDISGSDSATRFSFNIGGGLKWFLNDRIGIRLEVRAYGTLFDNGSAIFCSNGNCDISVTGNLFSQFETNIGVFGHF